MCNLITPLTDFVYSIGDFIEFLLYNTNDCSWIFTNYMEEICDLSDRVSFEWNICLVEHQISKLSLTEYSNILVALIKPTTNKNLTSFSIIFKMNILEIITFSNFFYFYFYRSKQFLNWFFQRKE